MGRFHSSTPLKDKFPSLYNNILLTLSWNIRDQSLYKWNYHKFGQAYRKNNNTYDINLTLLDTLQIVVE